MVSGGICAHFSSLRHYYTVIDANPSQIWTLNAFYTKITCQWLRSLKWFGKRKGINQYNLRKLLAASPQSSIPFSYHFSISFLFSIHSSVLTTKSVNRKIFFFPYKFFFFNVIHVPVLFLFFFFLCRMPHVTRGLPRLWVQSSSLLLDFAIAHLLLVSWNTFFFLQWVYFTPTFC